MSKPLLSIAIIFRNDIRCLERCLQAFQPLRDEIPCEVVMADTGSEDGSREVAEKYADIVFDFPWIKDFAAARNAVLDRCSGRWVLSVDTDEYLDADITQLVGFLRSPSSRIALVNIRNHESYSMDGAYSDFYAIRLVDMSLGLRYRGAIHERLMGTERAGEALTLSRTIFHHDGYVNLSGNKEKRKRNMDLLREELKRGPANLTTWCEVLDSAGGEPDRRELLLEAAALLRRKPIGWRQVGPPLLRSLVVAADELEMPEYGEWVALAEDWFPDSYFTRIDIAGRKLLRCHNSKDLGECVRLGGALLEAYDDLFAGRGDVECQMYSPLRLGSPHYMHTAQTLVANALVETGEYGRAAELLGKLDYADLNGNQAENLTKTLCNLYRRSRLDIGDLALAVWEGINVPKPSEKHAVERRQAFLRYMSATFSPGYRRGEDEENHRHVSEGFGVLAGKCGVGTASAILASNDPAEIAGLLGTVENWGELPYPAVIHAVEAGVDFPLPDKPMAMEDMQDLTVRISREPEKLRILLEKCAGNDFSGSWQTLLWACLLASLAAQQVRWQDGEGDLELARLYVKIERAYAPAYYSQEVLREGNLLVLPEIHRFGWQCVQAFEALEMGDAVGYARLLRKALASSGNMKPMVEFLLEETPELRTAAPSPELLELAEKVRTMLAAYPADDPAVEALKASPVYQKVAHLIEG